MFYFVNKVPDREGFHLIHREDCFKCFLASDIVYLGSFNSCEEAIKAAQKVFTEVKFCDFCLPNCIKKDELITEPRKELFE